MNKKPFYLLRMAGLGAALALALAPVVFARPAQSRARTSPDEFFIVSSVNLAKHRLVLKLPTEVTLSMSVTNRTAIVGEHGQSLKFKDLRSGDTAYIRYTKTASGAVATRIRLGPMTVEELHKRFLKGYAVPIPPPLPPKTVPQKRPAPAKNPHRRVAS